MLIKNPKYQVFLWMQNILNIFSIYLYNIKTVVLSRDARYQMYPRYSV